MPITVAPHIAADISDTAESADVTQDTKVLCIGIRLSGGSVPVNTITRILSDSQADDAFGRGSQLAQMCKAVRAADASVELWAIGVNELDAGTAASGQIAFSGTATTALPYVIEVEGQRVEVPLAIGDDGAAAALAGETELAKTEYGDLHVTAADSTVNLVFTARSKGIHGNEISIRVIEVPPGISAAVTAMASGAGAPDYAAALAVLGETQYDHIVIGERSTATLTAVRTELEGRWTAEQANDGHAHVGSTVAYGTLVTLGGTLDDEHLSVWGYPASPTNPWVIAAHVAGFRASVTNPSVSLRKIVLPAIKAAPPGSRLDLTERDTLMKAGIATFRHTGDRVTVDRSVTTYKTNEEGLPSVALRDLETKLTISTYRASQRLVLDPEISKILVDEDADPGDFPLGVETTNTNQIRALLIAHYREVAVANAWAVRPDDYEAALVVTKFAPDTIRFEETFIKSGLAYIIRSTLGFRLG